MIKELDYRVLMTFGGGAYITLNDSYSIASRHIKHLTVKEFKRLLHKLLSYGWIRGEREGMPIFTYKSRFGITRRGSDALEFYKYMRYNHTDKKNLLSEEGRAMITLPGEKYRNNGHVQKTI